MEISLTNLPILVLACTNMDGMPGMVNCFSTDSEKLTFLQEPLVTKAIQVYFQFLPITALSVFEVEWLRSTEFITLWYQNQDRLTDLYVSLLCDKPLFGIALKAYMSEMIPLQTLTEAHKMKLIENGFHSMHTLKQQAGFYLYRRAAETNFWCPGELPKLSGLIKSKQWDLVRAQLQSLRVCKPHRFGAIPAVIEILAETGQIEPLDEFLHLSQDMDTHWRQECILAAIRHDHPDLVAWLLNHPTPLPPSQPCWTSEWVQHAVFYGSLKCLVRFGPFFPDVVREIREEPPVLYRARDVKTLCWLMPQNFFGISEQHFAFADLVRYPIDQEETGEWNPVDLLSGYDTALLDVWFEQSELDPQTMLKILVQGYWLHYQEVPWRILVHLVVKHKIKIKINPIKYLKECFAADVSVLQESAICSDWLNTFVTE